jgi:hypothetical protein
VLEAVEVVVEVEMLVGEVAMPRMAVSAEKRL